MEVDQPPEKSLEKLEKSERKTVKKTYELPW